MATKLEERVPIISTCNSCYETNFQTDECVNCEAPITLCSDPFYVTNSKTGNVNVNKLTEDDWARPIVADADDKLSSLDYINSLFMNTAVDERPFVPSSFSTNNCTHDGHCAVRRFLKSAEEIEKLRKQKDKNIMQEGKDNGLPKTEEETLNFINRFKEYHKKYELDKLCHTFKFKASCEIDYSKLITQMENSSVEAASKRNGICWASAKCNAYTKVDCACEDLDKTRNTAETFDTLSKSKVDDSISESKVAEKTSKANLSSTSTKNELMKRIVKTLVNKNHNLRESEIREEISEREKSKNTNQPNIMTVEKRVSNQPPLATVKEDAPKQNYKEAVVKANSKDPSIKSVKQKETGSSVMDVTYEKDPTNPSNVIITAVEGNTKCRHKMTMDKFKLIEPYFYKICSVVNASEKEKAEPSTTVDKFKLIMLFMNRIYRTMDASDKEKAESSNQLNTASNQPNTTTKVKDSNQLPIATVKKDTPDQSKADIVVRENSKKTGIESVKEVKTGTPSNGIIVEKNSTNPSNVVSVIKSNPEHPRVISVKKIKTGNIKVLRKQYSAIKTGQTSNVVTVKKDTPNQNNVVSAVEDIPQAPSVTSDKIKTESTSNGVNVEKDASSQNNEVSALEGNPEEPSVTYVEKVKTSSASNGADVRKGMPNSNVMTVLKDNSEQLSVVTSSKKIKTSGTSKDSVVKEDTPDKSNAVTVVKDISEQANVVTSVEKIKPSGTSKDAPVKEDTPDKTNAVTVVKDNSEQRSVVTSVEKVKTNGTSKDAAVKKNTPDISNAVTVVKDISEQANVTSVEKIKTSGTSKDAAVKEDTPDKTNAVTVVKDNSEQPSVVTPVEKIKTSGTSKDAAVKEDTPDKSNAVTVVKDSSKETSITSVQKIKSDSTGEGVTVKKDTQSQNNVVSAVECSNTEEPSIVSVEKIKTRRASNGATTNRVKDISNKSNVITVVKNNSEQSDNITSVEKIKNCSAGNNDSVKNSTPDENVETVVKDMSIVASVTSVEKVKTGSTSDGVSVNEGVPNDGKLVAAENDVSKHTIIASVEKGKTGDICNNVTVKKDTLNENVVSVVKENSKKSSVTSIEKMRTESVRDSVIVNTDALNKNDVMTSKLPCVTSAEKIKTASTSDGVSVKTDSLNESNVITVSKENSEESSIKSIKCKPLIVVLTNITESKPVPVQNNKTDSKPDDNKNLLTGENLDVSSISDKSNNFESKKNTSVWKRNISSKANTAMLHVKNTPTFSDDSKFKRTGLPESKEKVLVVPLNNLPEDILLQDGPSKKKPKLETLSSKNPSEDVPVRASRRNKEKVQFSFQENYSEVLPSRTSRRKEEKVKNLSPENYSTGLPSRTSHRKEEKVLTVSPENLSEDLPSRTSRRKEERIRALSAENDSKSLPSRTSRRKEEKVLTVSPENCSEGLNSQTSRRKEEKIRSLSAENYSESLPSQTNHRTEKKLRSLSAENYSESLPSQTSHRKEEKLKSLSQENCSEGLPSRTSRRKEEKTRASSTENYSKSLPSRISHRKEERVSTVSPENCSEGLPSRTSHRKEEKNRSLSAENYSKSLPSRTSRRKEEKVLTVSPENCSEGLNSQTSHRKEEKIISLSAENYSESFPSQINHRKEEKVLSLSRENSSEGSSSRISRRKEEKVKALSPERTPGDLQGSRRKEEKVKALSPERTPENLQGSRNEKKRKLEALSSKSHPEDLPSGTSHKINERVKTLPLKSHSKDASDVCDISVKRPRKEPEAVNQKTHSLKHVSKKSVPKTLIAKTDLSSFNQNLPCISINSQVTSASKSFGNVHVTFNRDGMHLEFPKYKSSDQTYSVPVIESNVERLLVYCDAYCCCFVSILTSSKLGEAIKENLKTCKRKSPYYNPDTETTAQLKISFLLQNVSCIIAEFLYSVYGQKMTDISLDEGFKMLTSSPQKTVVKSPPLSTIGIFVYPAVGSELGRIQVKAEDIDCLAHGKKLNDTIIEFYLKYIYNEKLSPEQQKKTHMFNSFFYASLEQASKKQGFNKSEIESIDSLHNWTKNVDIFSKDFIFVPICKRNHWFLAVICFPKLCKLGTIVLDDSDSSEKSKNPPVRVKPHHGDGTRKTRQHSEHTDVKNEPCICFFDSADSSSRITREKGEIANLLKIFLKLLAKRKYPKDFFDWNKLLYLKAFCPQQKNTIDCGIYLCQYAESFFEKPIPYFQEPLPDLRNWFSTEIIKHKRTNIRNLIAALKMKQTLGPVSPSSSCSVMDVVDI